MPAREPPIDDKSTCSQRLQSIELLHPLERANGVIRWLQCCHFARRPIAPSLRNPAAL